jgi:hypothetical protein
MLARELASRKGMPHRGRVCSALHTRYRWQKGFVPKLRDAVSTRKAFKEIANLERAKRGKT